MVRSGFGYVENDVGPSDSISYPGCVHEVSAIGDDRLDQLVHVMHW